MNKRMRIYYWTLIGLLMLVLGAFIFARIQFARATGPIDPASMTSGNVNVMVWGKNVSGGNVWVGCIIRPNSVGTWEIIGGNHQNVGCTGISQDATRVFLSYSPYSKIVSFSFDEDETLTINDRSAGASVGLNESVIYFSQE